MTRRLGFFTHLDEPGTPTEVYQHNLELFVAAERLGVKCVTASGGVTCNRTLRHELTVACNRAGFKLLLAENTLCTDNAAMIGILAERKLLANSPPPALDEEIKPGWVLA